MQRYVLPGAALTVSAIALFVALSGTGVASGLVGQSRARAGSGLIARSFLVTDTGASADGSSQAQEGVRAVIGHFRKLRWPSIIEVTWTGNVAVSGLDGYGDCSFQLQIDGENPDYEGGNVVSGTTSAGGVPVGVTALFNGIGRGRHTLSVWMQSPDRSAFASCYMDPGNWPESFRIEEWS